MICERVAFRRAIGEGATVRELGKDPSAVAEVDAFFREVTT
jgi:chromosome partitioning protein